MNEISGLPSHPLLVHAPIILIPLLAVASIALAVRPSWRARWGIPLVVAHLALFVFTTILVMQSGEHLADALKLGKAIHQHEELADSARILHFLLLAVTAGLAGHARITRKATTAGVVPTWHKPVGLALSAVTVVLAVLTTIWLFRTGHSGAEVVWNGVLPKG